MWLIGFLWACAPRPYHAILRAPTVSNCAELTAVSTRSIDDLKMKWSKPENNTKTAAYLIEDGAGALAMRAWLMYQARSQVDMQYFIFSADMVGLLVSEALYSTADRGIKVRLLVDDTLAHGDAQVLLALDSHPNLEVRIYNPNLNIGKNTIDQLVNVATDFRGVNQRMHNKNFIVDNEFVITGGRNVGDEYFDLDEEYNFRDRDVFLYGQTQDIQASYEDFWQSPLSIPIAWLLKPQKKDEQARFLRQLQEFACDLERYPMSFRQRIAQIPQLLLDREASGALQWVDQMTYVSDEPIKNRTNTLTGGGKSTDGLIKLLGQAKNRVWIQTPYLVLTQYGLGLFAQLRKRGVEVNILTNSLAATDSYAAFRGYQAIRKELLNMGVALYEFRPDAKIRGQIHSSGDKKRQKTPHGVHAKSMIIDDDKTIVTTFNLDPRSANLNTENYVVLHSRSMNTKLSAMFKKEMLPENSWKITVDWNPDRKGGCVKNFWTFISVLVPRSLL